MRIMRLLVMFDLPTGNKRERKPYARFRKFLLQDGYHMEQFSVYSRIVLSRDAGETHLKRLKANLPEAGTVTVLTLTEKQFQGRQILVDTRVQATPSDPGIQTTLVF